MEIRTKLITIAVFLRCSNYDGHVFGNGEWKIQNKELDVNLFSAVQMANLCNEYDS